MFPTAKVAKITHTTNTGECAQWEGGTLAELRQLVKIGAVDPNDCQNNSPTIQEFLDDLKDIEDKVKLIGYVIYPPRDDARVSVEGFTATGLTNDQITDLAQRYGTADEKTIDAGSVRFWWD